MLSIFQMRKSSLRGMKRSRSDSRFPALTCNGARGVASAWCALIGRHNWGEGANENGAAPRCPSPTISSWGLGGCCLPASGWMGVGGVGGPQTRKAEIIQLEAKGQLLVLAQLPSNWVTLGRSFHPLGTPLLMSHEGEVLRSHQVMPGGIWDDPTQKGAAQTLVGSSSSSGGQGPGLLYNWHAACSGDQGGPLAWTEWVPTPCGSPQLLGPPLRVLRLM